MKLYDSRVTAHLMEIQRMFSKEKNDAILRGICAISTLHSLSSIPFLKSKIDDLMIKGLEMMNTSKREKRKKGKKEKREKVSI